MKKLIVNFELIGGLILIFCPFGWTEEWMPGIIHSHSLFSDGSRQIFHLANLAREAGAKFLIVTDHYKQINSPQFNTTERLLFSWSQLQKQYGFHNYWLQYRTDDPILLIPAVEIEVGYPSSPAFHEKNHKVHIIALGVFKKPYPEIDSLLQRKDHLSVVQGEMLRTLANLGFGSIAAHPNAPDLWREGVYNWYPERSNHLTAVEFFNSLNLNYEKDLKTYLDISKRYHQTGITSGCDSHHEEDSLDSERWKRLTYVYLQTNLESLENIEAKQQAIIEAIKSGHTYAGQDGARFEYLNYIPGFEFQEVDEVKFLFKVRFENRVKNDKVVRIYRDGNLIPESVQKFSKRTINLLEPAGFSYLWEDKGATGEHCYVIEVKGVLITSPIKLKIRKVPRPGILGIYRLKEPEAETFLELKEDHTCLFGRYGKWLIQVRKFRKLKLDGSYDFTFRYTLINMAEPLKIRELKEDEDEVDYTIIAEPLRKKLGLRGKRLVSFTPIAIAEIKGDSLVVGVNDKVIARKEEGAKKIKSSEGLLWSRYTVLEKGGFLEAFLEFKEDGTVFMEGLIKWEIEGKVIRLLFGEGRPKVEGKIENGIIVIKFPGTDRVLVLVKQE